MAVAVVAPGIWRAGTRYVNWWLIDGGADGLTVIDAGLPNYRRGLDEALAATGHSAAHVRALVLTHGHIDHVGMADVWAERGVDVWLHQADAHLAAHPRSNRPQRNPLRYLGYPGMVAFLAHAVAEGAVRPRPMPATQAMSDGQVLPVPGQPVVTHVPGHTDGSCLLEFREHDVVFVGDLLCTVSPLTTGPAPPQLQTRGSNHDSDEAMRSLDRLEGIAARVVLPGHGGPWRDGVPAAVASARRIGCR